MAQTTDKGFTLTKATKAGRATVKWGSIFLVVFIFGRIMWEAGYAYYKALNPDPPPPPTQGFDLLPPIAFPNEVASPRAFSKELATGVFPTFGDRAFVFFMPQKGPSLLDADSAKSIARRYDFTALPEILNQTTYRWIRSQSFSTTLELDIITNNFKYQTDYLSHPELILQAEIPTQFDAVNQVKEFLGTGGLLPVDVSSASGKITYLRAVGGELKEAVSVSDAQFIQVDINRVPVGDQYPIYTPDGTTGTIHAILASGFGTNGVVEMERNYFPIDYSLSHTYPLRSVDEAWSILQAGEGYIAKAGKNETAVVRDVTLGYFDTLEQQSYLQPIYVFTGDNGFLGYVPALTTSAVQATNK
jgi:hypothetical protein